MGSSGMKKWRRPKRKETTVFPWRQTGSSPSGWWTDRTGRRYRVVRSFRSPRIASLYHDPDQPMTPADSRSLAAIALVVLGGSAIVGVVAYLVFH
jgi:hypothetical protein